MSDIIESIKAQVPEVWSVFVVKNAQLAGEPATRVTVQLQDGRTVEGTFTKHPREGFGGVEFSGPKDIVGLMVSKTRAVLDGKAEWMGPMTEQARAQIAAYGRLEPSSANFGREEADQVAMARMRLEDELAYQLQTEGPDEFPFGYYLHLAREQLRESTDG